MYRIDLRPEDPPLGFNPGEIPIPDLTNFDPEVHRLLLADGSPTSVYTLPEDPGFLLRQHALSASDIESVLDLHEAVGTANDQFHYLSILGVHIPPHRHIEATMPTSQIDGQLTTIVKRLPADYQDLDLGNPLHIPGALSILRSLTGFAADCFEELDEPHMREQSTFLWDIFEPKQFSVSLGAGAVALHDIGLELAFVYDDNLTRYSRTVHLVMGKLDTFAARVVETSKGSPYETRALARRAYIKQHLPKPEFR